MIRTVAVGVLMVGLVAACGGSSHPGATTGTTAAPATPAPGVAAPSSTSATTAKAGNAAVKLYDKLVAAGLPVTGLIAYDAATDENHLLGRPGQYTAKISWQDSRVPADTTGQGAITGGGSIETFATADQAKARAKYIQAIVQAAPILGVEYDYLAGGSVVRVSSKLTPDQAAEYGKATGATLYTG